jgi:hypothetical protein
MVTCGLLINHKSPEVVGSLLQDSLSVELGVGKQIQFLPLKAYIERRTAEDIEQVVCLVLEPILITSPIAYRHIDLDIIANDLNTPDQTCMFIDNPDQIESVIIR